MVLIIQAQLFIVNQCGNISEYRFVNFKNIFVRAMCLNCEEVLSKELNMRLGMVAALTCFKC